MTPEKLIEQCELAIRWAKSVQAGKAIEIEYTDSQMGWKRTEPQWNFRSFEYREKQKPREGYVVLRCDGPLMTKESAERIQAMYGGTVVHMREVTDG